MEEEIKEKVEKKDVEEKKSAFELLEEMYNSQKALGKRMVNLEEALLLILNELREKDNVIKALPEEKREETFTMEAVEEEPKEEVPKEKPVRNIRVVGKIKSELGKGISDIKITIWDERNNQVKGTITNKAGNWFSFLPPGKYTAHYLNEDPKIDKNVNFEVKIEDKEVKV
jgi:hypothetical protein